MSVCMSRLDNHVNIIYIYIYCLVYCVRSQPVVLSYVSESPRRYLNYPSTTVNPLARRRHSVTE